MLCLSSESGEAMKVHDPCLKAIMGLKRTCNLELNPNKASIYYDHLQITEKTSIIQKEDE